MRIVGGRFKGRALAAPKGRNTRPTSDRAREAMFNVLAHADWATELEDARVIDLFAGSGALGLEAMSRGAGFCLFVETEAAARGAIRDNIDALQLFGHTRLHRRDATALGEKPANLGAPFDLVFLDPPYGQGLGEQCLKRLVAGAWLSDHAIAVLEVGADEQPDVSGWKVEAQKDYGAAKVLFLSRA
ncbi:16S rRNA (guanine(966)-N(2))-methyltransferase RsmD [Maricaulis sp.]|uniref:16S rRNA (guanine(966)-N(2))-methyltransferase RsmD n=1 Tax=Maricaulis sp. TaxID=1486257 RepID=UPI001B1FD48F|nr:16S rRNA (guanine(966)-N(2))-methyltransferase RsmD [Maricaulis sp.]MBO6796361.1 16S rRNA (guanine(966)-N(2))-methyltransferase RsmD [Maricaulis sp.]